MQLHADLVHLAGNLSIGILFSDWQWVGMGPDSDFSLLILRGTRRELTFLCFVLPAVLWLGCIWNGNGSLGFVDRTSHFVEEHSLQRQDVSDCRFSCRASPACTLWHEPWTKSSQLGGFLTGLILGIIFSFIGATVDETSGSTLPAECWLAFWWTDLDVRCFLVHK